MHFSGYIAHYPPPCGNNAHLSTGLPSQSSAAHLVGSPGGAREEDRGPAARCLLGLQRY